MKLRRADQRGFADHGWLKTFHTFSFANYYDPAWMGFRSLRVLNDDRVAPGAGFPRHAHSDMEIVTMVLEGALAHSDSMGNGSVIRPGEVQKMSAGTGVVHSEMNASEEEPVHFLQIWIEPAERGVYPMYQQRETPLGEEPNRLHLLAAPPEENALVTLYQDARLYGARMVEGETRYRLDQGRAGWIHLADGDPMVIDGETLGPGDGGALDAGSEVVLRSEGTSTVLLFDLG